MIDITHKFSTLRVAVAEATVHLSRPETMDAVKNRTVPKGDVLEMAKTAGLFGVKKTADMIPDCHPMPVEFTGVTYEMGEMDIRIQVTVKTIYKTGVEVEAMHGASVVALTMYDMLKPIDKGISITNIRLLEKSGGKSDFKDRFLKDLTAAVVVCSDTISKGKKSDKAGLAIKEKLEGLGLTVMSYEVVPDEIEDIRTLVKAHCAGHVDLIILTGGTGLSSRDVTPEAIRPLLDMEIPGVVEASRNYGQQRTPYSMLSRAICGVRSGSLILALPGSTKGATESMDALFPALLHSFGVLRGQRHD